MQPLSKDQLRQLYQAPRAKENLGDVMELIIRDIYELVLRPGDGAIDGGACRGLHTFPIAELVGSSGRVYSFEPIPDIAQWLRERIAERSSAAQITLFENALADSNGPASFVWVPEDPAYSGLKERYYPQDFERRSITVNRVRLDDTIASTPRIAFIKLDLEGGEYHALRGAAKILHEHRPVVVFEFGRKGMAEKYDYSREDFFELLKEVGYESFDLFGHPFDERLWDDVEVWLPWYQIGVPKEVAQSGGEPLSSLPSILARHLPELRDPA
jgi:FkbM family methyltransferase